MTKLAPLFVTVQELKIPTTMLISADLLVIRDHSGKLRTTHANLHAMLLYNKEIKMES